MTDLTKSALANTPRPVANWIKIIGPIAATAASRFHRPRNLNPVKKKNKNKGRTLKTEPKRKKKRLVKRWCWVMTSGFPSFLSYELWKQKIELWKQTIQTTPKRLFGFAIFITHNSVFITHNSKMVGPIVEKPVWFLFLVFVSITQFSNFWVMSYGNWKHLKCVFSFHNSSLKNQKIKWWK